MSFGCFVVGSELRSNVNLLLDSWRIENSSRGGNLLEASSTSTFVDAEGAFASNAPNGSFVITLIGEGLGLGTLCSESGLDGLPRRIGTTSGMKGFSSTIGTLYAPAMGGEVIFGWVGGRCWFRRTSECVRVAYI